MSLPYNVPGMTVLLAQPNTMACWATVYTMMKSWKDQSSYDIGAAVLAVGQQYRDDFDNNTGLPPDQFGPFLAAAGMTHEPMENLSIDGWDQLMESVGLLWVGTLASPSPISGLHSRIIEGMYGDGTPDGTYMKMIDPAGGVRYDEQFSVFIAKYEGAFQSSGSDQYFQIRHF